MPEAVVRHQARLVALAAAPVLLRLGGPGDDAAVAHPVDRPAPALALERLLERHVGRQQVDVLERDGLVGDVVSGRERAHGATGRYSTRPRPAIASSTAFA